MKKEVMREMKVKKADRGEMKPQAEFQALVKCSSTLAQGIDSIE
jgi:hypothetical protein